MMTTMEPGISHRVSDENFAENNSQYWNVFQKYDKNNDGRINVQELADLIHNQETEHDLPMHVVARIHERADSNTDGHLDFQEFVSMVHNPDWQVLFGGLLNKYVKMIFPIKPLKPPSDQTAPEYEDQYSCCPPPIGVLVISILEIIFFCIDLQSSSKGTGPIISALIYDPCRRYEIWRYITYMLVHVDAFHLVVNVSIQIVVGCPLEMIHKWWRVLIIYLAGVIAGSLGTSVLQPTVKLAGASAGVWAVISAHISTIIMNWKEKEYPLMLLAILLLFTGCDMGTAIYNYYVLGLDEKASFSAHLGGVVAGLLVGISILRNIVVRHVEDIIWWAANLLFISLLLGAIILNIVDVDYFPVQT